ncbi:MAG: hypothetical protein EPO68_01525 [Planctomycetota bacterium]|nr:MAG: hypothetical protein EPO68_01525 [Planctomycetota bacterium]
MPHPLRRLAIGCALLAFQVGEAAAHDRVYELYDWRNGLGNETVLGVAQDAEGFIWIGTTSGLLRFDGSEFKRVSRRSSELLPDRSATGPIYLMQDGELAVVRDGVPVPVLDAHGEPMSASRTFAAVSADGSLWFVSAAGAQCLRPDGARARVADVSTLGECRAVSPGPGAALYAWSGGTLLCVEPSGERRAVARMREPARVLERAAGGVVALDWDGVVVCVDAGVERVIGPTLGRPCDIVERGGTTWASFDTGLYRIGSDDSIERIGAIGEIPGGPALLVDRESNVWMPNGPAGAGLFMFPELDTVQLSLGRDKFPRSVVVVDGAPWFGAWWGAFRAAPGPHGWQVVDVDAAGWSLPVSDAAGRVWIASNDSFTAWSSAQRVVTAPAAGVRDNFRGARARDGGLWLPTNAGLFRVDAGADQPRRVLSEFPEPPVAVESTSRWHVFESSAGDLFVAQDERVCCGSADDVARGGAVAWRRSSFGPGMPLTALAELRGFGVLAAVTNRGFFHWDGARWIALPFAGVAQPVPRGCALAAGEDGTVWLLLEQELMRIRANAQLSAGYEVVERLSPRQGLPGTRIGDIAADGAGGLWLVLQSSVVHLPAAARARTTPPWRMQLVEASVDGRAVDLGAPIELPYSRNRLQLRFAALSYTERSSMRFRLRLHPDEPWEPALAEPVFRFVDLPSGRYDVEAQSSADGVHWPEPGVSLGFAVLRPWYLQSWFVALALVALAGAAFGLHRLRVGALLRLERQRARIAMDLHDEIGAGLGGIGLLAELAARPATAPERRVELAGRVAEISARLSGSLQDIVWSLRPGATRLESLAAHIVERGHVLCADGKPEFVSEIPERLADVAISLHVRRDVLLIAQEALHNVRRHAAAARVRVRLEPLGRRWRLSIADDGVGLRGATTGASGASGLGLDSMRQRARRIRAELAWRDADGGGTLVTLVFDPTADTSADAEERR